MPTKTVALKYESVAANDIGILRAWVCKAIEEDENWLPIGGMGYDGKIYYQTMIYRAEKMIQPSTDKVYRLCYIEEPWAYFTTKPIKEQWGDDWNDAPYEHNAGLPYEPFRHDETCECDYCKKDWNEDGTPKWEIIKVTYYGPFDTPCSDLVNSPYSVEQINNGAVPWLRTCKWEKVHVHIFAGTTLDDFIKQVQGVGGEVFIKQDAVE